MSYQTSDLRDLLNRNVMFFFSEFNMALLKAASQSETLWNYDPNLAVDGDSNTCSFTPQSDVQRWWQVSDFFLLFLFGLLL